jgi:hypothetical protein
MTTETITELKIDKIGYDKKYYPRVNGNPDWMTILRYTQALEKGTVFPPITVVKATAFKYPFVLLDGLHRLRSYLKAGLETIPATIERVPQSKWMERSVILNCEHGRQLDNQDKAWIATRMKEDGYAIDTIADLLKMKVESLEKIVVSRCVKIDHKTAELIPEGSANRKVNGSHYGFLKAPLKETVGTKNAIAALQTQHSVTSHDVESVLDSFICILTAGVINMAKPDIAARVKTIKKLIKTL